ncbi:urocanate hydratase isoform X1 [Procambarus clarkii]|uniref:urocanate hydratase isoform X1 n=1 Tax=Procambarus clarkii TaxID=6728 RepID=UPI001E67227A|nr:urocanate hydratase-like [Procambarus clarkii]
MAAVATLTSAKVASDRPRLTLVDLCAGLPLDPLPPPRPRDPTVPHAPIRAHNLSLQQQQVAVSNALRYFPRECHALLAEEFVQELRCYGHIYMYRFLPNIQMKAYPLAEYPAKTTKAAAMMHMIMNNLDPCVAQFPHELVTYGGNGQVFSNWAQVWLVLHYLSLMTEEQTLVLYSGHPLGLFPSDSRSPRLVTTNGMVIPNYSSRAHYDDMFAMGVTMYGQMTAGSYCYIGPQGIVHGSTLTVLNAGRKYLKVESLAGRVLVTSGLGGMSGAQAKAAVICGCIGVVAEVNEVALKKRYEQGWLEEYTDDLEVLIKRIQEARTKKQVTSIGYLGNVVNVWERLVQVYQETGDLLVDLGTDQTSCHIPFHGGYCPVQLTFQQAEEMLAKDPKKFRQLVEESLCRQVAAINTLAKAGLFFWDYGNAFLLEARRAGADVGASQGDTIKFLYPSYVQDIMGDIFSLGFGPFRWVCTSGDPDDLKKTDDIACAVLKAICDEGIPERTRQQYSDNIKWIVQAGEHKLVVGSQARILYSDQVGRVRIAQAFNEAVKTGQLKGPVVISRDHHDVSGTDSPFRETSNVYDGSAFTADMAIQNFVGDAFRGATWVALHNGGGVGWGEVINGGFGLVLDGSDIAHYNATLTLNWDVSNGVARRAWSGNENAEATIIRSMSKDLRLKVTIPYHADPALVARVLAQQ